ncbi:MAG TPA: DUF3515 family protein [Candidatus Nanopelagicales bacterium]|nr:DUF3515 family protein [Candidatus Nanopelagicales bacterium]
MAALLLTGCSRVVSVTPPPPDATTSVACAAVAAALPETVAGQSRRSTTPDAPSTAAWGDPPIVLRCGVPRPAALLPTSPVTDVTGPDGTTVTWFAEQLSAGYLFTTVGRQAYVEVAVPDAYRGSGDVLPDLGTAVGPADPVTPATG